MDGPRIALKVNDRDNVATIFANGIHNGSEVELRDKKGFVETLTAHGEIPYGHKIAVRDIKLGELIFKYGEEIGIATQNIRKGDHVHIQNLDSLRGRGDLPKRRKLSWRMNLWDMSARMDRSDVGTMWPSCPA